MNKTSLKVPIKYLLFTYRNTMLVMYLCVYLLAAFTAVLNAIVSPGDSATMVMESVTAITIFVIGLNSFKEDFKFFSANSISRRTQFFSTAAALGILSVIFAFIDTINSILFSCIPLLNYHSIFAYIYEARYNSPSLSAQLIFENFFWLIFLYFWCSMLGLFITTLYYRMNKGLKIAVSIAVPILLIFGPDPLDRFTGGRSTNLISAIFRFAFFGNYQDHNPYIGMLSMFIFAAFSAALAFVLARKADIKK
ncbi:MAG TPA: hypothetical protein VHP54_09055 [Caproiciproducens sp.]|nr:hypothetical protein [Caproiciproducens sp.]